MKHLTTIAVSAVVALIVTLVALNAQRGTTSTITAASSKLTSALSAKEIRSAYAVGAPLFVVDANTSSKSGIFHDLTTEAFNRLGISVKWTNQVGYGEMIEGIRAGRYDIVGSGVWINSARAAGADFSAPFYYDAVFAYTAASAGEKIANLADIDNSSIVISTMDGELGQQIAKTSYPKARRLDLPQGADFSQMIQAVVSGRADVVFLALGPATEYQRANPGTLTQVGSAPVRIFPNAILLPQGDSQLRNALNAVISEMHADGTVDRTLSKYELAGPVFLRVAPPYENPLGASR